MDFVTAVKTCFRKYFRFGGRARRSEFWYWALFTIVAGMILGVIDVLLFDGVTEELSPVSTLFSLVTFIPGLAVSWRRLHDINRSGWWVGGMYLAVFVFAVLVGISAVISGDIDLPPSVLSVIGIVALIGIVAWGIALLVFFCTDTKSGDNRFGEDPKYGVGNSVFD
ncbi:MAG: DUF805 domain-containing protein [Litorimonas sp.]